METNPKIKNQEDEIITKECAWCQKEYTVNPDNNSKYCSSYCEKSDNLYTKMTQVNDDFIVCPYCKTKQNNINTFNGYIYEFICEHCDEIFNVFIEHHITYYAEPTKDNIEAILTELGTEKPNLNGTDFKDKLMEYANALGELILDTSNEHLINVFEHQGFWSGVDYRIYYKDGKFSHKRKTYGK